MADSKTTELYRKLKKAEPNGDFKAYENRIEEYLKSGLDSFIRSLRLSDNELNKIIFFKPDKVDVLSLESETERYKAALTGLLKLCREYIRNGTNISNIQVSGLFKGGKLNLSTTSAVEKATSALQAAKYGSGGIYLTQNPLEILISPVTFDNVKSYREGFSRTVDRYLGTGVVRDNNFTDYLKDSGCTFVSQSFVNVAINEANTLLTDRIRKQTKTDTRRLALSVYIPLCIMLVLLTIPVLVLTSLKVRAGNIHGYRWIIVVGVGLACGFVPMLSKLIFEDKLEAHRQYGTRVIKMVSAPLVVACIYLAALLAVCDIVLWSKKAENFTATAVFSAVYFLFYVIAVTVSNKVNTGNNENDNNSSGLRNMFFWLPKILVPFCVSILFANNLSAYVLFNIMAIATCIIYDVSYELSYYEAMPSSFVALGLSLCFSFFITALLALCKLEGLYVYYLSLFNFNVTAMYVVSIIFILIVFAAGISLTLYFFADGNTVMTIITLATMLAIAVAVYIVGFVKMDKLKKSDKYSVVGNCVLVVEKGELKRVYGSTVSLEIPDTVTKISSGVFKDKFNAKELTVPDSVTSIAEGAFKGCNNLQSVSLPFVGSDAENPKYFGYIFGKKNYAGSTEIKQGGSSYYLPSNLTSVTIRGGKVGDFAFTECFRLQEVKLESAVKSIGKKVFYGCSGIQSLTLPYVGGSFNEKYASVTTLLGYIFAETPNEGFSEVTQSYSKSNKTVYYIPSSLKNLTVLGGNIFYGAFSDCRMLETVTLEKGVQYIETSAFAGCSELKNLTVPFIGSSYGEANSGSSFFGYIFGANAYYGGVSTTQSCSDERGHLYSATYYIPLSLKNVTVLGINGKINSGAFSNCKNIERLVLPTEIKSIGYGAFDGCEKCLKTVGGVRYVNNWVVGYEKGTTKATVANKTVGIADGAFDKADTLESFTLPESVTYIGADAFRGCTKIADVNYTGTVEKWGQIAFANENSSPVRQNFSLNGKLLTSLNVPKYFEKIPCFAFRNMQSLESLTIPEGVTGIENGAFGGCTYLTEINYNASDLDGLTEASGIFAFCGQKAEGITVTVGTGVKAIPQYLFYTADKEATPNIVSLKFDEKSTCTTIGSYSFINCESLKEAELPESVTTVFPYAFPDFFTTSESVDGVNYVGNWAVGFAEGITSANIRNGTVGIADEAFKGCPTLKRLSIPSTVEKLGKDAFLNCYALEEVTVLSPNESYGIENFLSCRNLKKFVCPSGTYVKFVSFYNPDGSKSSMELLTSTQTISSGRLRTAPQKTGYLFGGWYTDKSYLMRFIKTQISTGDTGFINLYPYYISDSERTIIPSDIKSLSDSVSNNYTDRSVTFDVSRMNQLRNYGYRFSFKISYSTTAYNAVVLTASKGHTTDYTASCSTKYTLSYTAAGGTVQNTKNGPSVSAKIGSNWFSGGSNTGRATSLVNVAYDSAYIYGDSIKLSSSYCYNTSLGKYGKAVFEIPEVTVNIRYTQA